MIPIDPKYKKQIITRQKQLSEILGVSGHEEKVVDFLINEIESYVDKYWVDVTGNLLAVIQGPSDAPAILLDAHTDEIGFIVTHVTNNGFVYFVPIGGWDERLLLGQNVIIEPKNERIHGIIGALPPHILSKETRKKLVKLESLWMDFGFLSQKEAFEAGVKVGTIATLSSGFHELPGGRIMGKAFDDRSGCNILVQTALNLQGKDLPYTFCFAWSSQEEIGLRGATTASYTLSEQYDIQMAIATENTTSGDVPGVPPQKCPAKMGKGPAITIADRNMIASRKVVDRLVTVAESNNIPYQFKIPSSGGTDAGRIHLARSGIPSSVVSVPGRYIHSQSTIIDIRDLIAAVDLVTAFCLYSA